MERFVIVVPTHDGMILCGRKKTDRKNSAGSDPLVFPGGTLQENEKPIDGAQRELFEETALSAEPDELLWRGIVRDLGKRQVFYIFSVIIENRSAMQPASDSADLYDLQWRRLNELPASEMLPEHELWVGKLLNKTRRRMVTIRPQSA